MQFISYPILYTKPSFPNIEVTDSDPEAAKQFSHQNNFEKLKEEKICFFKLTSSFQFKAVPNFFPPESTFHR